MGFRLQKRVSILPGLRLNFGLNGISATLGVPGASINFGKRGVFGNLGVPGTGLSYRTRLDHPAGRPGHWVEPNSPSTRDIVARAPSGESHFRSASVDRLSSEELRPLADLVRDLVGRRAELERAIGYWKRDLARANARLSWARSVLLRKALARRIPLLESAQNCMEHEMAQLEALLEGSCLDADFALTEDLMARYDAVCAAFSELRASFQIWDVSRSENIDRVATRSAASQAIERKRVSFFQKDLAAIASDYAALHLSNANGDDLYLYPGFLVVHESDVRVALIDLREVTIECEDTRFIEEEPIPGDARTVGSVWAKSNKDGSRDRRFADNREIPVALYGRMLLRSPTGLHEAYHFSRAVACQAFGAAFKTYQRALPARESSGKAEAVAVPPLPALEIPGRLPVPSLWPLWVRILFWTLAAAGIAVLFAMRALWLPALEEAAQQWRADSYRENSVTRPATPAGAPSATATVSRPAAAPASPSPPPVAAAFTREEIRQVQGWLNALGYIAGTPDGTVGPKTSNAIKLYQTAGNLPVTGKLDPQTWAALQRQAGPSTAASSSANRVTASPNATARLAMVKEAIHSQIDNCRFVPTDVANGPEQRVTIRIHLDARGYVIRAEILATERMGDPLFRRLAESAYRASINPKCQPHNIGPGVIDLSQPLDLAFSSR